MKTIARSFCLLQHTTAQEAEWIRQNRLREVYVGPFSGLGSAERKKLALSGNVWWEYAKVDKVKPEMVNSAILHKLQTIDTCPLNGKWLPIITGSSPTWHSFRLDMTHHSTALEGNQLSLENTAKVMDVYADRISMGHGITNVNKYVVEVVNHAAAMEFVKANLLHQKLSMHAINRIYRILMPPDETRNVSIRMQGFELTADNQYCRGMPIHVRGSSALRPYPLEVPACFQKIIDLHYDVNMKLFHPVIASILFMLNFLFVHPYEDGNGRVSRLLLWVLLYNSGYQGCIFPVQERDHFMSLFNPCFVHGQYGGMLEYVCDKILHFQREWCHDDDDDESNKKNKLREDSNK